jgi:penicillin-binding protein 1A
MARDSAKDAGKPRRAGKGKTAATAKRSRKASGKSARKAKGKTAAGPNKRRSPLRWLIKWCFILAVWLALAVTALIAYYAYDLPEVDSIAEMTRRPSVRLLAADGSEIATFGQLYGEALFVDDLPPQVPQAVLAIEDRRFYSHFGIDPWGVLRAMIANLRAGSLRQGGSTITQQLAKNLFLTPERTLKRKVQEVLLALWLERKFSKPQILSLYLNRVYLGAGTYGVDAAARRYFGISAREVGLYQAAMLAGLLKAPSRYNPASSPDLADRRARVVLQAMVEADFISEAEAAGAARGDRSAKTAFAGRGRHFADWVMTRVEDYTGRIEGDVVVTTTLDPRLQRIAEEETARLLDGEGAERDAEQAAAVILAPDGAVRAMVGGRAYGQSQFNRATQALRQPGSAFKLFVYLAGIEAGLRPDSRFEDAPIRVKTPSGPWAPKNYAGRYYGEVTLREAFARSLNSVAVRVSQQVGPEEVAATARRLGITTPLEPVPSLALGAAEVSLIELTGAYATFANGGAGVWPYAIREIREAGGPVLFSRSGGGPGPVVSAGTVNAMTDLMHATVAWGSGKAADPGRPAAGKTGTSQDSRDAWFVGYTAELVAGVWFGNDDGRAMRGVTGGGLPAQLWRAILARSLADQPSRPLPRGRAEVAEVKEEPKPGLLDRLLRDILGEDQQPAEAWTPERIRKLQEHRGK